MMRRLQDSPFGAAIDVSLALNPDSVLIPITRIEGVTRAVSAPLRTNQLFAGRGALVQLGIRKTFSDPRARVHVYRDE